MWIAISIITTALIVGLLTWQFTLFGFKCWVEQQSKKGGCLKCFGEYYFFMTQDQIQRAAQSVSYMQAAQDIKEHELLN